MRHTPHNPTLQHATERAGCASHSASTRRAFTLLDLTVALAVVAMVLTAAVSVCDALVNDSADRQTAATLQTLNNALHRFYETHGTWPSATEPALIDTAMARCIAGLRSSPATEAIVADLPGLTVTPGGWLTVRDGFGNVMLYVNPESAAAPAAAPAQSPASADAGGRFPRSPHNRPFIVSAGQDGAFGDLASDDPAQRTPSGDNLYSYAYAQEVKP